MATHTLEELHQWQALPLSIKISMTKTRIREWIKEYGEDGVYVSFSGGKDSTVLSHLVDETYPGNEIPRVFCDTGLEYPEIREFVKKEPRAVFIKPKYTFKQVIEKYGYPFISKEVSQKVHEARSFRGGRSYQILHGAKPGQFDLTKWNFFMDAPFEIHNQCCHVMKKNPAKKYEKETGRKPMTGQMASESRLRTTQWLQYGCNAYDKERPVGNPMAFWTEQDVLLYIKTRDIEICSVYGEIVTDYAKDGQLEGQVSLTDLSEECGLFDLGNPPLKTTWCDRTGCMFCGYGCHLEKAGEGRFERMKITHPQIYDYIMRPKEKGGLNYKEVIDWINEHGNLNIRY